MAKASIAATVEALLRPTVEGLGYRLWDVEYAKIGADWNLTIVIDNDEGITIEDCEVVHRAIDPLLDEADPIENAYCLNVSSPGIERDLKTDEHILLSLGEKCEARLFAPVGGQKVWRGYLVGYEEGILTLTEDPDGEVELISLPRTAVSKLQTVYFD
jgi:ribosome maturation factor RimP